MAYNVVVLLEVRIEVLDAAMFYEQLSSELRDDLIAKFYEALNLLTEDPLLFQADSRKHRKINLNRFPYKIVFQITGETIVVMAFAHHKRRPGYWKKR